MKIPHHGSPAFLNTLHRDTIINAAMARTTIIRTIASHPKNAHAIAPIPIIASLLMFPVSVAHESSKEKFIFFCYINKVNRYNVAKLHDISSGVVLKNHLKNTY